MSHKLNDSSGTKLMLIAILVFIAGCSIESCLGRFGFPVSDTPEEICDDAIWGDGETRASALKKLQKLDDKSKMQILPVLVKKFEEAVDREEPYCSHAIESLSKLGPIAVPYLADVLIGDSIDYHYYCDMGYGIVTVKNASGADAWVLQMRNKDFTIASALKNIGTSDAKESFNRYIEIMERKKQENVAARMKEKEKTAKEEEKRKEAQRKALASKTVSIKDGISAATFLNLAGTPDLKQQITDGEYVYTYKTPWDGVMQFYFMYTHYTGTYHLKGIIGCNEKSSMPTIVGYVPRVLYDTGLFGEIDHKEAMTYSGNIKREAGKWYYEYYLHGARKWALFE